MSAESCPGLTYETLVTDPLIRLVMESDGVSLEELVAVLEAAGEAVARRQRAPEGVHLC